MRAPLLGAALAALIAFAAFAGQAAAGSTDATAPRTGSITNAVPFTVAAPLGDQTDPHIQNGLVSYTDQSNGGSVIDVYDVANGSDVAVPNDGGMDFLSDTSGGKVVYTHLTASSEIRIYDTLTGAITDTGPSGVNRSEGRIGGDTLVWQDFDYTGDTDTPEMVAYDIATGVSTRLTDDLMLDKDAAVSPDGNTVVWTKCQSDATECVIWEARRGAGGSWSTDALTSNAEGDAALPDTDGRVVVYSLVSPSGDEDVYWQPVGGGTAHEVSLPGQQTNPDISNGVVVFQNLDTTTATPNYDVWAYDIASNTVYRLTQSPADETLADVEVSTDRQATVVWSAQRVDEDVLGETFTLPPIAGALTLTPSGGSQNVGTQGAVTATVDDQSGDPLDGADVRFTTSGAVTTTGSCTTAADGTCSFTYAGPATPGSVDVAAFVDANEDGVAADDEPSATATRDFVVVSDTTAPTVSVDGFTDGQLVLLGAPRPVATCSSSDDGSGVVSTTGPTEQDVLTANGVGTVSVTCTATDAAGNTASATKAYRIGYAFGGFLAPIQGAPAVNTGHAGRAYPLKWQLADANGVSVSALSAIASIRYAPVACDGFTGGENAVDATTTGESGLRYDANEYAYTWATPKASGCYALTVALDSGQAYEADFRLS